MQSIHKLLEVSRFSRRRLFELSGYAAISGIGATLLAACGSSDSDKTPTANATSGTSSSGSATTQPASTVATGNPNTPSSGTPTSGGANVKRGGTIKMGLNNDWSTIDPLKTNNSSGQAICGLIYSQLLKYYHNSELVPDLAEKYEMVDPTTFVFHLRSGIKFHDGSPLTAADVKASYDRILDPENGVTVYSFLSGVDSVTANGDLEVQFKLKAPQATFISALGLPGNYIAQAKLLTAGADLTKQVVGTGPFKFVSETTGVEAKIERNSDYFVKGLPYLDGVTFRPLTDDSARTNALYSGAVDIITYVPWAQMDEIEKNPKYILKSNPEDGFLMIDVRVDRPPLDNKILRQAISYGIDREAIIKTATSGRGKPCYGGIIPSWMWGYNKEIDNTYEYNPDKAKQLVQQAGAQGTKLELISWPPDNELFGRPSVVVANQLNQIGITIELKPMAVAPYHKARSDGSYQLLFDGTLYDIPDPDFLTKLYHTGGSRVPRANRFSDTEIDQWLDQARTLTDKNERIALYDKVQKKLIDEQPIVMVIYREQGEATQNDVKGHEYLGARGMSNYMLETWLDRS